MAILNFIYLERVNVCLLGEIKKATSPLPFEILDRTIPYNFARNAHIKRDGASLLFSFQLRTRIQMWCLTNGDWSIHLLSLFSFCLPCFNNMFSPFVIGKSNSFNLPTHLKKVWMNHGWWKSRYESLYVCSIKVTLVDMVA